VNTRVSSRNARRGALITELVVAMAILTLAVMPLAFSFVHERQLLKRAYYHAAAMEIVDGEMEILAAGEWRSFAPGQRPYIVRAGAAAHLPPGEFQLTVLTNRVRLEWIPQGTHVGGRIAREALVK
jgi:hypothetical protein